MPLTLYRYILVEMVKLLAASTAVLVVLLSVGSSIKPISEGLLGPWQMVKVIVYTVPGMLTFALPFAAAFAGTLVFFRMSADNEVTACAAGGVSYRELLTPVLALGLTLTLGAFFLSNWVVPTFWGLVAKEIEQDVAGLVTKQIRSGEVVELGRLILYADDARDRVPIEERPPGQPRPYNRLVLDGVAVGKLTPGGGVLTADYTAERAVVDLYRNDQRVFATMMLSNVTINDPASGTLVSVARQPVEAQEIPSPFQQDPKFLSLPELKAFAQHPEMSAEVRETKGRLSEALAAQQLLQRMRDRLNHKDNAKLHLTGPRGQRYRITSPASTMNEERLRLRSGGTEKIEVRLMHDGGREGRRIVAERGRLEADTDGLNAEPRVNLLLEAVEVFEPSLPTPSRLRELTLPLLRYDEPVLASLRDASIHELMAQTRRQPTGEIKRTRARLSGLVISLIREIGSRLHERAAMAVNIVLVLLLGAVMSMWLRNQVPLAIFFWCFMPTVAAFLTITSGQNMMQWDGFPVTMGAAMLWSGNAALAVLVVGVYLILSRN